MSMVSCTLEPSVMPSAALTCTAIEDRMPLSPPVDIIASAFFRRSALKASAWPASAAAPSAALAS